MEYDATVRAILSGIILVCSDRQGLSLHIRIVQLDTSQFPPRIKERLSQEQRCYPKGRIMESTIAPCRHRRVIFVLASRSKR